ncbi:MAG: hypothetical protein E7043_10245 [Lentisphaerae bacterium]|nr:hypothetical protein [Lentisphaerota bacterium]
MKKIIIVMLAAGAFVSGRAAESPFQIHSRGDFEEEIIKQSKNQEIIYFPQIAGQQQKSGTIIAMRAYHHGKPQHLHPLKVVSPGADGTGKAVGFEPINAYTLLLMINGARFKATPDLYAYCKVFVPEDFKGTLSLSLWNDTKNKSKKFYFQAKPGWNVLYTPLYGAGSLDEGDSFQGVNVNVVDNQMHKWIVDDIVIWQGQDTEKPAVVTGINAVTEGDKIKISYQRSSDNLAVKCYRIYRGSVPGFKCDKSTLRGESDSLEFFDALSMRSDYYYNVTAVDCAGLESLPGQAVQMK